MAIHCLERAGAVGEAFEFAKLSDKVRRCCETRQEDIDAKRARSPMRHYALDTASPFLLRTHKRVFRRGGKSREPGVKNEMRGPLRVGRSKHHANRRPFRAAKQCRARRSDVIHDGADVIHTLFEGGDAEGSIRQALAALVEGDDASKRRDAPQEIRVAGDLVQKLHMRGQTRDKH